MVDNIIKINIVEVASKLAHDTTYDELWTEGKLDSEDDMYIHRYHETIYKEFVQERFNINYDIWYSVLKENEIK